MKRTRRRRPTPIPDSAPPPMTPQEIKARCETLWEERGVKNSMRKARWYGPGATSGYVLKKDEKP